MRRKETVEVRVTESRKERWEKHVQESTEVANLSDFVRLACEQKISGAIDRESIDIPDVTVGEKVESEIKELDSKVNQVVRSLAELESELVTSGTDDPLVDDLKALLIEVPDKKTFKQIKALESNHPNIKRQISGTPEALADILGVGTADAQQALVRAERLYPDVKYMLGGNGSRRYYRLNPDVEPFHPGEIDPDEYEGFETATEVDNEDAASTR
jgi:hypothetical protein